jgi:hypothetical protein
MPAAKRTRSSVLAAAALLALWSAMPQALLAASPDETSENASLSSAKSPGFGAEPEPPTPVYRRPSPPPIDAENEPSDEVLVQAPLAPVPPPANAQPAAPAAPPAPAPNVAQAPPAPQPTPPNNFLSSSIGVASSPQSFAPFMIGDALGGNIGVINNYGLAAVRMPGGLLNTAGRIGLQDNFSPMPRDRVFFDYSDFQDVPMVGLNGPTQVQNVNRFSPGFEKTFFDRWTSIEVRMPVAYGLNNTLSGTGNTHSGEFGDLLVSFKTLLTRTDTLATSGGMALTLPTAQGISLVNFPGVQLNQLQIQNRAVYFQPYLASLWTPNDRFYMQGLASVEVASGGNQVSLQFNGLPGNTLGNLNNQTYLNFSVSTGYWAYLEPRNRYLTGIAPIFELHQSQTVSGSNQLAAASGNGSTIVVGQNNYHFQLLNVTTGVNVQLGPMSSLLMGYTTPLGSGSDKLFAGEFSLLFNRRFGPQNRLTRSQF